MSTADAAYPNAIRYESIQVGQALGPVRHQVTVEMIRGYVEATGEATPECQGPSPIAPPSMATIFSTRLMGRVGIDRPSGGIHAKHEYTFLAPLQAGRTVTTTGRVVEKELRRGRKYAVYETVTVDDTGEEIVRCRVTQIHAS